MSSQGTTHVAARAADVRPERRTLRGEGIARALMTTDHKKIGTMYFITTMGFFMFGGVLALLVRSELAFPGLHYFH